ncbi:EamA family transporter RarD [Deferribacteraceae bacterium V6Fe1]|nr:EamA family transporter RarD [Deferribacteraceae bacterium V6Fe1]
MNNKTSGLISAIGAFLIWGFLPLYWKLLKVVPAFEILTHRIIWSTIFLFIIILFQKRLKEFLSAFKLKNLKISILSGLFVGGNWLLYIWAVNNNYVIESSLGYYINPLISVLIGKVFFKETLTRTQIAAIITATFGVLILTFGYGRFPWIAVTLSLSFAIYGALRKISNLGPIMGLQVETILLIIPAGFYFLYLTNNSTNNFLILSPFYKFLLIGAGVVTSTPLLLFAQAVRNINLSTVGMLQYIGPTINFLLGVFIFKEEFSIYHLFAFILIWIAVALFSSTSILAEYRKNHYLQNR